MNLNGNMTWTAANALAYNLAYCGFNDWRLPTLHPPDTTCSDNFNPGGGFPIQCFGFNCTGDELSGLFVTDFGNKSNAFVLHPAVTTAEQIANLVMSGNVWFRPLLGGLAFGA